MEIQFGPNPIDEPNLLYKLQRKIKVFNTNDTLPNRGYNLVASSSKYGLVFVAVPDGVLTVYHLNQLVNNECEPQHLTVQLQEKPTHIAVSCDFDLLAVTGGQLLAVYKVADFQNSDIAPSITVRTDVNLSTFVAALQWNPCIPDSIAIAFYDGTLFAAHLQTGQTKKIPAKARCICWSPKGKQLVTGNNDGTLTQYKPDLTPAKSVPAPNLFEGNPVEALAIYWISTFQFAVVYRNAADNSRPALTIINTPKAGQPSCLNYEDICYSMGSNRPWYYYLQGLSQWNVILSSSSNSMEIATLASADGVNWQQWCQSDEARPELPLTDKKQENYPVGMSIDTCAVHQLPWGENETLPHMPLLHVLSQTGLLTTFNIINLKKEAQQVCTAPVQISLPAHVMSSSIPGEVAPQPAAVPQPAPAPMPEQVSVIQQALQTSAPQPASQFGSNLPIKVPSYQPQTSLAFSAAPPTQVPEQKPIVELKPAPVAQTQTPVAQPKPQPAPAPLKPQPTPQQIQEKEALKAEQEKLNKIKANQEMKDMLVKEVNDFQMELYNFMVKTRETQARLQRDIESMTANFTGMSIEAEDLKKECSIDDMRSAIVQLKLELVRACAVVAEARTHSDARDLHQWIQADPLTTKRVASVKKLAYYVQTQLEQAQKALEYKWTEFISRDPHFDKPGKRMIRPALEDVYQPLVKQQEILCRQQAVLRTLKNAFKECDIGPVFKSTSLLRSTPFKNRDPLSKLTKNILNMSIEPETKTKSSLLTPEKLDALRDVLSNHKTIRIKSVNVELRQHLTTMREKYEKSLKEKEQIPAVVKTEPEMKPQVPQLVPAQAPVTVKLEPRQEPINQYVSSPAFKPFSNVKPGLNNVARTLFTDEPKQETPKPQPQIPKSVFTSSTAPPTTADAKAVLKDLLTTKQANLEAKNNANMFMGQKICSPTAFAQPSAPTPASAPSAVFTSKPIAEINNMFNKFQPQSFASETKPFASKPTHKLPNVQSSETGEPEETIKPIIHKYKEIPTDIAVTKPPLAASTPNVPDVLKSSIQDKVTVKPLDKPTEKTKENVPEKTNENSQKIVPKVTSEKNETKPLSALTANKSIFGTFQPSITTSASTSTSDVKPIDLKTEKAEPKVTEKNEIKEKSDAKSIFASATASAPVIAAKSESSAFTPTVSAPSKTESPTTKSESEAKTTDSTPTTSTASSVFSAAVAAQPKTTSSIFSTGSSIFSSTSQNSVFGTATTSSIFGSSKTPVFSTSTPAFGTATTASSVFGQTSTTPSAFTSTAAAVFASSPQSTTPAFGTVTASTSVFGATPVTTTTASVFGSTTTASSAFGSTTTPAFGTTTSSVFGASPPSPSSVFAPTSTPSISSVFGSTPTSQTSVFGATTTAASAFSPTTTSIFGTATTTASIFATASTQASSVFGQASQSVFGATTQASIFGATTQASVFGSPSTQTSVFGSPSPTTQASVFGTPTQSTQSSIFGTPTAVTQASVFGTPPQANQPSVFGAPQTSQASIFGSQPATTASQGSLFGGGEANLFAAASISTTSAPSQASGGNIFGSSSGSVFGGGSSNVFGGGSAFGQGGQSAGSIFGGAASFGQKPASSIWGSGASSGGFGSSGFGQQATTQSSSIFGSSSGGSFSAPSAGAFGSPQQGSAFGSPQQQSSAFGGSPVFGSKPVFGQPAGFGSPTGSGFGAPASFGGFNKSPGGFGAPAAFGGGSAFGGGGSPGGFAAAAQSNATFESLATQNTLTFGNLAQQSSHQPAPSFNASPSFTGWRG